MALIDSHIATEFRTVHARPSLYELATDALAQVSEMLILLFDWQYRARARRQLRGLSDQALKDFGASRADALGEGGKPFWRA